MTDFRSFEQKLQDHREAQAKSKAEAIERAKARMKTMTSTAIRNLALNALIKEEERSVKT